ncbi:hypothetical protein GGS21DRAFT_500871 [Xylaria nigripes]|nr:hypothetical protein GGS21DRAFT_500871 [Xylaria nigripes]
MAQHAWLDSLSEDWVSQGGSDTSQQPLSISSSPPASTSSKNGRDRPSFIPRLSTASPGVKRPQHRHHHSSPSLLSERNPNHNNSAHSGSSKFSQSAKLSYRGRLSRSCSASTASSVAQNSVIHNKSQSTSPSKGPENVPEWRRRLIHGELGYGESKDLFSSAAIGLENMFRPPQAPERYNGDEVEGEGHTVHETTLPSSPPPYSGALRDAIENDDILEHVRNDSPIQHNISLPRPIAFRPTGSNKAGLSSDDLATTSDAECDESGEEFEGSPELAPSFRIKQLVDESRKISGQSDVRHEDFSPIYIARHSSEGGSVSFAPMELPADQLYRKLQILRENQRTLDPEPDNDSSYRMTVGSNTGEFENTAQYVRSGSFFNLHKGGRSAQGSFVQPPPTPPINIDTSEMLAESSLQASTPKRFPVAKTGQFLATADRLTPSPPSPFLPRAPHPSPEKRTQPVPFKTSSPLKLFGPYDTYTNQTLLRRISQFEDQQNNGSANFTDGGLAPPPPLPLPRVIAEPQPHDESTDSPDTSRPYYGDGQPEDFNAVNKFGAGELDDYEFEGDISMCSSIPVHSEEKENVTPSPSRIPSANFLAFDIHEDVSFEGTPLSARRHRHKTKRFVSSVLRTRESKSKDGLRSRSFPSSLHQSILKRKNSEAKRPRTSPSKDPTPKRRRTLHRSDIAYGLEDRRIALDAVYSPPYTVQSAIRDRKPLRRVDLKKFANSDILSTYHGVQPTSPTPNRRTSELRDRPPLAELGFNVVTKSVSALASEENTGNPSTSSSRKVSMKTQDFFDAAEEVMAMIRNKARPVTGLASVGESDTESPDRRTHTESVLTEDSFQESTQEPFSRPPSRDGRPISRIPVRQEDPTLADHLRKYAENSDSIDMLGQSTRSIGNPPTNDQRSYHAGTANRREYSPEKLDHVYDEGHVGSDIPNIRISHHPENNEADSNTTEVPHHSRQSSGSTSERFIPTISSRGSDSKRLIGPDVVARLIGNQVGNMVFDDVNKMWQKVKTSKPAMSILHPEDSEDDPFASIPDLTVDTNKEKQSLDLNTSKDRFDSDERQQSRYSVKNCLPKTGNKTTGESAGFERLGPKNNQAHVETAVEDDKEIEHEISLHEDRIHKSSPSRRKNLTITFSSPIASIIQDVAHSDLDDDGYESNIEHSFHGSNAVDSIRRGRHVKIGLSSGVTSESSSRSRSRGASRNFSTDGHAFIPRPVSRIDEQDENASDEKHHGRKDQNRPSTHAAPSTATSESNPIKNADLRVMMATPDQPKTTAIFATPIIGQYVGTLSLSPMSEFTVHQVDNSCALEVSYVVGDKYLVTGDRSKKIMSKAVRSLVEKITEIEPFEPDWETLPELDLSNKQLDTLHMLDEFCKTLVTLDGSNNTFSHLDGVPRSVRNLRMTHNVLSEITAWRQLINLQYVNVSNNQIKSLSAFKDLVHLRSLHADNNQITSLDGIRFHDSLQVLRARGNQITYVDFDGTKMQRLTELDLENNQIVVFKNCEQLTSLSILNLQHNCLTSFALPEGQYSLSLKFLKLSNNNLQTLDLAAFPYLRLLHADRNNITTITGFSHCQRLDSLSLREQKGDNILDTSFLDSACEVRKLFLSGNRLSGFNPQVDFLNLQYLELANCGLQSLAPDIGQLMPNLRMLNINFNAIDDLWPLRFIPRLKKLLAAGNRLADASKIAYSLAEFSHLSRLDLRNNGATLGFYTPVQTFVSVNDSGTEKDDLFELPDVDVGRHDKRASRLDMDTRMRKRIYDMVILNHCRHLKMLDGLPVLHDVVREKDDVWHALVKSGIIEPDSEEQEEQGSSQ